MKKLISAFSISLCSGGSGSRGCTGWHSVSWW